MNEQPVHGGGVSRAFVATVIAARWLVVPALVFAAFASWWWLPGISSLPDARLSRSS